MYRAHEEEADMSVNGAALAAVMNGMDWLDEHYSGWRSRMNVESLTLEGTKADKNCAYVQATGHSYTYCCLYEPDMFDVSRRVAMGFTIDVATTGYTLASLADAWKHALTSPE